LRIVFTLFEVDQPLVIINISHDT